MFLIPVKFAPVKKLLLLPFMGMAVSLWAQQGGTGVFSVLKMVPNAKTNAWGGFCNAWRNGDATFMMNNPALMGPSSHNTVGMNFNTQFPGVWSGNGAFVYKYKNLGYFGAAFNFIDYGSMDAYDAGGNAEGQVTANESVMALGYARELSPQISYGVNLKVAYSILATYVSNGFALDLGAVYTTKDSVLSAGLVLKNAGFMVQHYREADREKLPFQAEIGINFKPKHMPFRFNIVAHDLQKPDLTYNQYLVDNNNIDLSGEPLPAKEAPFADKVARHITLGTELVLGKNFGIMAGYNHQRKKEMAPVDERTVTGFSWGMHFKVSKFSISYSSAAFFPGFNTNLFTFSAKLSDFRKKSPSSAPGEPKN